MSLPKPYYQSERATLYCGDCLDILPHLGKVDAVVTDPPYGTTTIVWDKELRFQEFWSAVWPKLDDESPVVMTARQPFTTKLIHSAIDQYRHGWVWNKHFAGAFVLCNRQPMQIHEDICVFGKAGVRYIPQMIDRDAPIKLGGRNPGPGSPISSPLPDSKTYHQKYPTSIIDISNRSEARGDHPTQKPVGLAAYLVQTYSEESHTILDPFTGSGTTGVACIKTGRKFIGIEIDEKYCAIAARRIREAEESIAMFTGKEAACA